MAAVTLSVPDISCDHCKQSIEGALKTIDGVHAAEVHVASKTVDVNFDETKIQQSAIGKAIEDQGFTVAE
ncbi:MAG: copper ion binding protein [Nitrospirales bacterium]|nr:heavy-metal-associated domain-containing protein [Nitrospira sp.]MDR4502213.1 copper ion binding protein [Nitrospirales bacterium]